MSIKNNVNQKYFHCYATANDSLFYLKDLKNLRRIKKLNSGVNTICLFIAISKVKKINLLDKLFVRIVKAMFSKHRSLNLKEIFYKKNIGRDFSSFQMLLNKVKQIATDEDFIFFQNRSGYGPFRNNWYKKFVEQFQRFDSVAICGSTINFMDHPKRSLNDNLPHVQTYSFLSQIYFMNMLGESFPGANELLRLNIIIKGEIGLSQFFLERKYRITCIEWPDKAISNQSHSPINIDIKTNVKAEHFFYHKKYFKKRRSKKNCLRVVNFFFQKKIIK